MQEKNIKSATVKMYKKKWPMIVSVSIGGILGVLIIFVLLIPAIVSSGMVKNKIVNSLETGLNRNVQIDNITMSWSGGLDIKNIHIRERDDLPGDTFVKIKRILCDIDFLPLMKKRIRINDLKIDSPEIVIQKDEQGRLSYEDKRKSAEPKSSPGKVEKPVPDRVSKPAGKPEHVPLVIPALLQDLKIKAQVSNGKLTFIDHQLQEETRISALNSALTIDSLNKSVELKSDFDIEAKGEREHADISLNVSLAKEGSIDPGNAKGTFNLKTGFAQITTDFDLAKFKGEGGKGLDFFMNVDLKKLTNNLAGILGLPKGMRVEGTLSSRLTADGQWEKVIDINGNTDITNLNISGGPLGKTPIHQPAIKCTQKADLDLRNDKITVYKIEIDSTVLETFLAGLITDLKSTRDLNFKIFLNSDLTKLNGEIGNLLPEDMEFAGRLQSNINLAGRQNIMKVKGRTVMKNIYAKIGTIGQIREPEITISNDIVYDMHNGDLELRNLGMNAGCAEIKTSGTVINKEELDVNVLLTGDIEKLTQSLQGMVKLPQGLRLNGKFASDVHAKGSLGNVLRLDGATIFDGVNATGGPLQGRTISDPGLKLLHTLDYKRKEDSVNIEMMDIKSEFLNMESKGGVTDLSKDKNINYDISMEMNLDKITEEFAALFPVDIDMQGRGKADLEINGKVSSQGKKSVPDRTTPVQTDLGRLPGWYEQINFNGTVSMDKIQYDAYTLQDVKAGFVLDDGFFTTKNFLFMLNGGEGTVTASANLKEEKPPVIFDMRLTDANINQNMDLLAYIVPVLAAPEGELSGKLNMQFEAAGNGLHWQDDLSKSLHGEGAIEIADGSIRGGKLTSRILRALGKSGEYRFDNIITRFVVKDSRIANDDIVVNGKDFDIGLSGWTSFDGRIEYSANAEALSKHVGRDARKIIGALSQGSKLPIVVAGTIAKPKISFKWPKAQDIGNILQGILGGSGESKPQNESSGSQQKAETEAVEREAPPTRKREEDAVERLFKGLFIK